MGGADISMPAAPDTSAMRAEMAMMMEQQREQQQTQWQQRQDELRAEEAARLESEENERRRIKQSEEEQLRVQAEQEAAALAESQAVVEGDVEDDDFIIDFYGSLLDGQEGQTWTDDTEDGDYYYDPPVE